MVGLHVGTGITSAFCLYTKYNYIRHFTPRLLAASLAHPPAGEVGPLEVEATPEARKNHDLAGYTANHDRHREKPSDAALEHGCRTCGCQAANIKKRRTLKS